MFSKKKTVITVIVIAVIFRGYNFAHFSGMS